MGKNIMVYFNDEALAFIEHYANRGTLLNELVVAHFSNDEEVLREKVIARERELSRMKAALQDKVEERLQRQRRENERKELTSDQKATKDLVERFFSFWQDNKIDDDTYWSCFPTGKDPLYDKMKEIIADKNKSA